MKKVLLIVSLAALMVLSSCGCGCPTYSLEEQQNESFGVESTRQYVLYNLGL